MTVVVYSRGSELSIENGTRTDLPATPKVGRSRLKSSTSGSRVRLPTGTANTGTPLIRSARRRLHRRLALVPVAVGGQHDAAQVLDPLRRAASGSFRSVPCPGLGSENGWITTFIRSRSLLQVAVSVKRRDRLAPR